MAAAVQEDKTALLAERDPEVRYYQASILAFYGQEEVALALLRDHSAKLLRGFCPERKPFTGEAPGQAGVWRITL